MLVGGLMRILTFLSALEAGAARHPQGTNIFCRYAYVVRALSMFLFKRDDRGSLSSLLLF